MDKTSRLMVAFAASALLVAGPVDAQDVVPVAAASQAAASASAPADTLPSDPTVAPWAPPGGHPAKIETKNCPHPAYPDRALRANAQGVTQVMFTIDAEGQVVNGAVLKSAGVTAAHKALDHAVLYTFGNCAFTPGTDAQGSPTTTRTAITYTWKLD